MEGRNCRKPRRSGRTGSLSLARWAEKSGSRGDATSAQRDAALKIENVVKRLAAMKQG